MVIILNEENNWVEKMISHIVQRMHRIYFCHRVTCLRICLSNGNLEEKGSKTFSVRRVVESWPSVAQPLTLEKRLFDHILTFKRPLRTLFLWVHVGLL